MNYKIWKNGILVIFWLLASFSPVFGGGNRDTDLSKADKLISEKKYDEAIQVLSEFARRNPEKFDHAQDRFRKIYKIRDDFNNAASELLDTVTNDPGNSEKILALTQRMEELEDSSSPILLSYVNRIRGLAQFNHDRRRLSDILEQGRAMLDRGDYYGALQTYAGGMEFYRREFYEANYGEIIENQVRRETESINSVLEAFQSRSAPLGTVSAEMNNALNAGSFQAAREANSRLIPAMDTFIELKQTLYSSLFSLERLLGELRSRDSEMGDRNHIAFLSHIIRGRQGESIQEGMLGALDAYWNSSIGTILDTVTLNAERAYASGLNAFNAGDFLAAARALERNDEYLRFSPLFFEKRRELLQSEEIQLVRLLDQMVPRGDIPSFTKISSLGEGGSALAQTANIFSQSNTLASLDHSALTRWQQGSINAATAVNTELQTRNTINSMLNAIEIVAAKAVQADNEISAHNKTNEIKAALNAINSRRTAIAMEAHQSAQRYYSILSSDIAKNLPNRRGELEKGNQFLEGQRRTSAEGIVVIDRYPSEALETLTRMLQELNADLDRGNTVLTQSRSEPAEITADTVIAALLANLQTSVNEMTGIQIRGRALAETARGNVAQAEAYRQEGERIFREAQAAYSRQSFDTARDRLQRATERFANSLAIQESASLRQAWDTQLLSLGQAISRAENELIIAEVRNLVNTARNVYFAGNFEQAEEHLVRARNRWRLTNAEENEEIIYWLGIVRSALSVRSGRTIPVTAPLYAEMSQLLSAARKNYEEGVRFINAGSRSSGLAKFQEAMRLTREVKLMFPVNQEAGILELRIEQFTDPAAFNSAFEQRIRAAIAGTKQRSIESFADLQNLAEINPRYPGLRNIITQAEIDMNFRLPPPNPANIARSNELTQSAGRILNGNITTQYEIALAQINEAITLNPNNTEAPQVKDRLLNRMGAPGAIVLSSQDEAEYQRAVRELQAGNNLVALAVVERLMQNPRNQNITKLIELQRRIQSVL